MRKVTLSCALVLGLAGAAGALGVGCSSDGGGGDETPDAATDAVSDTGKHDATGDSSHPPTDSGQDAGQDTGQDTGTGDDQDGSTDAHVDGGVDANVDGGTDGAIDGGVDAADAGHDSGADTGPVDSGSDVSDAGPTDTGAVDTGTLDTGLDTGIDAALDADVDAALDAGLDANVDASDAATPYTFANPLQVDVSSVLDVNTIAMLAAVDAGAITSMDGSGYDFLTASRGGATCKGLPDTAFFAASGTTHPQVQLHWTATSPAPNSHIAMAGTSFSFPVPAATYTQFQIYGVSTEGSSSVKVTLTYSDATTNGGKTVTFADWYNANAAGQFSIVTGLDRIGATGVCDAAGKLGISGVNVIPDPTKIVTQVTVLNNGTGTNRFVFYGATAF